MIGVPLSQRSRYGSCDVDTRMSTSVNKVEILSETKSPLYRAVEYVKLVECICTVLEQREG